MKNRILPLLITLLLSGSLVAQTGVRIGSHEAISWKPTTVPTSSFATVSEGRNIAQQIISIVGLKPNFDVREANVPNAAAVTYGGKRYVLYNPNFITQLERSTGTRWAGISVLAHEIGHHLNGHTITATGSQPSLELEADEFSGFVLRKMGASLTEAQAAMKTLASINASKTHPGKYDRLASIEAGWNKADAQVTGRDVAKTTPVVKQPSRTVPANTTRVTQRQGTTQTAISAQHIIGTVRFNADPSSDYFITTRYNLVKVKNNQLSVIGKLSTLKSSQYPYLLSDDRTQLLVDVYGNIMSRQGKTVGKLTAKS